MVFRDQVKMASTYRASQLLRALLLDGNTVPDQAPHIQDLEACLVEVGLLCREVVQQSGDIRLDAQELNADLCSTRQQPVSLTKHAQPFIRRDLRSSLTSLAR